MKEKTAFFISDRTGLTIESMGDALLDQFGDMPFKRIYHPFIDSPKKAYQLVEEITELALISQSRPLIFSSIINAELRNIIKSSPGFHLSFFDAFLSELETELGMKARYKVGKNHGIADTTRYDERISSVDFSLNHDDGVSDRELSKADVILMGVSRSGKTPTCLYLALHYGIRAANYPLTPDDLDSPDLPPMIKPYLDKVYGLTIDPDRLSMIRQGRRPNSTYSSLRTCRDEVATTEKLFGRFDIPCTDVTHKSIEELAVNIIQTCKLKRRL